MGSTPLIFVNRRNPIAAAGSFVGIDNRRAGEDAARWALARNASSAALIHAPLLSSATRDRVAGVTSAFAAAGRPLPSEMVLSPHRPDHLQIGRDAAADLIAAGGIRRFSSAPAISSPSAPPRVAGRAAGAAPPA